MNNENENKIKNEQAVKVGAQPDASKQQEMSADWMKSKEYIPESPYFQYIPNEFTKLWITKKQPKTEGAFQPVVEVMKDDKGNPVYNEYKDGSKVLVKKATWQVINAEGKVKTFGVTVGGGKSLYAKINSRITEAFKEGKSSLGLKIKKTGSGMTTTYDIETNNEPRVEVKA